MPHASRHKLTPADGGGDRKRLISSRSKIACELFLAGFLFSDLWVSLSCCRIPAKMEMGKVGKFGSWLTYGTSKSCVGPCGKV